MRNGYGGFGINCYQGIHRIGFLKTYSSKAGNMKIVVVRAPRLVGAILKKIFKL